MVPLSYFAVPKGVDCPPSTPPLQVGGAEAVLASSSTRTAAVAAAARHYLHDQFAVNQQYKKVMQQPQPQSQHQLQVHVSAAVDADACVAGKNVTFSGTEFETKYLVVYVGAVCIPLFGSPCLCSYPPSLSLSLCPPPMSSILVILFFCIVV